MGLTACATLCNTKHTGQTKGKKMRVELELRHYKTKKAAINNANKLNLEFKLAKINAEYEAFKMPNGWWTIKNKLV